MAAKINNFQIFQTPLELNQANNYQQSCLNKKNDDNYCDSTSIDSSCSFSSTDLMEDATSPSSTSSSSSSNGPLFQLSDLMDKLPIKRGLSKYYQGKSESFTSLASVESLEDLAKRENPYNKRIKLCRSYCGGFDAQKFCSPKPTISKKSSAARRACSNNLITSCRHPPISSVQKHF